MLGCSEKPHNMPKSRLSQVKAIQTLCYPLALASLLGCWVIFGGLHFAYQFGYQFYGFICALGLVFLLTPILLRPIAHICQTHQLSSLADLMAFRYQSQTAGSLTVITLMIITLPFIGLQFKTLQLLNIQSGQRLFDDHFLTALALLSVIFFVLFFFLKNSTQLIVSLAIFNTLKWCLLLSLTCYIFFNTFENLPSFNNWISEQPRRLSRDYPVSPGGNHWSLLLAWFCLPITLPHAFHLLFSHRFSEKDTEKNTHMTTAAKSFPINLWLISLVVPILLWSASKQPLANHPEYFLTALLMTTPSGQTLFTPLFDLLQLTFLSTLLTTVLATLLPLFMNLSDSMNKHIVLAAFGLRLCKRRDFTKLTTVSRRILVIALYLVSFYVFLLTQQTLNITEMGILCFLGTVQLIPGIAGTVFWPKANARGFISGLAIGLLIWCIGLFLPSLTMPNHPLPILDLGFSPSIYNWQFPTAIALILNSLTFVLVSILTPQTEQDAFFAKQCAVEHLNRLPGSLDHIDHLNTLKQKVATKLDSHLVTTLLQKALHTLNYPEDSHHSPYQLRYIREQLQTQLNQLLGPILAKKLLDDCAPLTANYPSLNNDIHFIEEQLAHENLKFSGVAEELNQLRRYHREMLNHMPLGVLILSKQLDILFWNKTLEKLTKLPLNTVIGAQVSHLKTPWKSALVRILEHLEQLKDSTQPASLEHSLPSGQNYHLIATHISSTLTPPSQLNFKHCAKLEGILIVIEDLTTFKQLQRSVAHTDRLAAIGQLAAGVAHEIGNPVTAIDCIAQDILLSSQQNALSHQEMVTLSQNILQQTRRITDIVRSLTAFSHANTHPENQHQSQEHSVVDCFLCLQEAVQLLRYSEKAKNRMIKMPSHPTPLWCHGNQQHLQQVFINLLDNACDATPDGNPILIGNESTPHQITLTITDQGPGIPNAVLNTLFDPFITTKPVGQGTGLGLYLAHTLIGEHKGSIKIENLVGYESGPGIRKAGMGLKTVGAKATVSLPRQYPP